MCHARNPLIPIHGHAARSGEARDLKFTNHFTIGKVHQRITVHVRPRYRSAQFRRGMPSARLKRVLEFIEANLGEDISLSALAEVASMGPHYFSDLFKQSTGLSPHQYVLRRKMGRAKEHLQNPRISVVEVSAILGFADQSYFTKVFRRALGATPTEFRANLIDRFTG